MTREQPLTLTKYDLAHELKVSIRSIERMRKAGLLPPTVVGLKRPRWATSVVMRWLQNDRG